MGYSVWPVGRGGRNSVPKLFLLGCEIGRQQAAGLRELGRGHEQVIERAGFSEVHLRVDFWSETPWFKRYV